jgi:hypothetical protein
MAYNEETANRIRLVLFDKGVEFTEKKMFSGMCFMVDEKMCCGTHIDKKLTEELLLCRIGEEAYEAALEKVSCIPMEFTGRPMKGYVFVRQEGHSSKNDLEYWIQLCLDFNPLALKSKKKR